MTPPQFPRDVNLLDSYHELQELKVDHANLKSAMNTLSSLHSSRDVKYEALQGELAALKEEILQLRKTHKNVCELDKKEIVGLREELDALKAKMKKGVRVCAYGHGENLNSYIPTKGVLSTAHCPTAFETNALLILDKPETYEV